MALCFDPLKRRQWQCRLQLLTVQIADRRQLHSLDGMDEEHSTCLLILARFPISVSALASHPPGTSCFGLADYSTQQGARLGCSIASKCHTAGQTVSCPRTSDPRHGPIFPPSIASARANVFRGGPDPDRFETIASVSHLSLKSSTESM